MMASMKMTIPPPQRHPTIFYEATSYIRSPIEFLATKKAARSLCSLLSIYFKLRLTPYRISLTRSDGRRCPCHAGYANVFPWH